jgi:CRISPR-associated protein Cmr6
MPTDLQRTALRELYRASHSAHPGLLIQRGLAVHDDNDSTARTHHVAKKICPVPASPLYRQSYERWARLTADDVRFRQLILRLETRLFIGLSAGGMLATGCAIGHAHGVPYIPGSSIKGPVRAQVGSTRFAEQQSDLVKELFGTEPSDTNPLGLSGVVTFHDAWWVPDSAPKPHTNRPLVQEVVTTHHPDYYQNEGAVDATDFDSPVPNAQIAVHGSFLFVLEGDPAWTDLAARMLTATLSTRGLGAKTRAGYGFFSPDADRQTALERQRAAWAQESRERAAATDRRRAAAAAAAALDAATPQRRQIMQTETRLSAFMELDALAQRNQRSELVGKLNDLAKAAVGWTDQSDRAAAAALIEGAFEQIGWSDPDKKKSEQRKKQEAKRRQLIAALRGDHA